MWAKEAMTMNLTLRPGAKSRSHDRAPAFRERSCRSVAAPYRRDYSRSIRGLDPSRAGAPLPAPLGGS